MSRPITILCATGLAAVTLFAGAFLLTSRVSSRQMARPTDDLEWLRMEFRLSPAELDRVRGVHEGYLAVCQGFCTRIAEEQRALRTLVEAGQGGSEEAATCLARIGELRAECQAAMLRHFEEVSRLMPTDQGVRYLEVMRRLTLGSHEQIERSMSGSPGNDGHVHH